MSDYTLSVLFCAFLSMIPVSELRGAIPVGMANGISPVLLYFVCVLANLLPAPILILFLRRILGWMQKCGGILKKAADWLLARGEKKTETVRKYEQLGLFILVAIPLPGTGAWTGALVAALLNMRLKKALPPITAGVAVAGVLVMLVCKGVIHIAGL